MRWFANLRTAGKLAIGFGICQLLALLIGVIAVVRMGQMDNASQSVVTDSLPGAEAVANLFDDMKQVRLYEWRHMQLTDAAEKAKLDETIQAKVEEAESGLAAYEKSVTTAEDKELFGKLKASWEAYLPEHKRLLDLSRQNDRQGTVALLLGDSFRDFSVITKNLASLLEYKKKHGVELANGASAAYASARTTVIALILTAFAFGIVLAIVVIKAIVPPLNRMSAAAQRLAVGDVDQQIDAKTTDEIGALAASFRDMIAYQKQMAGAAGSMAEGDLGSAVEPKGTTDVLGHAFSRMTDYQKQMAAVAQAMAVGDVSRNVDPKSERDVLGRAFADMIAYQREMADAANTLAVGDVSRTVEPKSAQDALGQAFTKMIAYQKEMAAVAELLAQGDLTRSVTPKSERDQLGQAFSAMVKQLSELIAQARVATDAIAQASAEVSAGSEDLSQRTTEQASSLEETASSMEEMTSTVKQNADNAQQANQLAAQAREVAEKGGTVVSSAVNSMDEINKASKRIADIISVIDEIAFQTNLLALNAAVEAARVGEQGRGFAVVAAEVRSLAGRSATAAKEIKTLVQDTVAKVQDGTDLVNQSGEQLEEIVRSIQKVADIVAEISAASQEQSAGIEQVNKAVMQMDQITQQNAALVEEASASSQATSHQAKELQALVARFKVEQTFLRGIQEQALLQAQARQVATGTHGAPPARGGSSSGGWAAKGRAKLKVVESPEDFETF